MNLNKIKNEHKKLINKFTKGDIDEMNYLAKLEILFTKLIKFCEGETKHN